MKYHTTKKAVLNGYSYVICMPQCYCNIATALSYFTPVAYTTRVEGWGADIYEFTTVAFSTGYAPFGIKPEHAILDRYDKKIKQARARGYKTYSNEKRAMYRILIELINDVTGYHLSKKMI